MEAIVAVGAIAMSSEFRKSDSLDALAQGVPSLSVRRRHSPCVELQIALGSAGFREDSDAGRTSPRDRRTR